MSMNTCFKCGDIYDTDFQMEEIDGEMVCDRCFEDVFGSERAYYNKTCQLCWDKTMSPLIRELQHFKDTSVGLWCTDKLESIPEDKKHLFFQLK